MDEDFIRDRLFKPFFSTKASKGMGVGAYQAREYVRSLGGAVNVDSTPGEGTTFTIRLPLAGHEGDSAMTDPSVAAS
jgi:signal transduction histidine kinase